MIIKENVRNISKKLCVQYITQEFFPLISGPANLTLALSVGMKKNNILAPILTTTTESDEAVSKAGVIVHRFKPVIAFPNFRVSPKLIGYLLTCDASIFHVQGWRNPVSDIAILISKLRRIPLVIHAHGIAYGYKYSKEPPIYRIIRKVYERFIRRLVISSAFYVIATSTMEANELIAYGFEKHQIETIPLGIEDTFFVNSKKRLNQKSNNTITLLTVARLAPRRNLEQVIQAVAALRNDDVDIKLRIVGSDVKLASGDESSYSNRLIKLTKKLGINNHVFFVGSKQGEELIKEYSDADIFIYTTLYENFGFPIAEAAASGLPIVATPTGIAVDLLKDEKAGYLIPFRDVNATFHAVKRLCLNSSLRESQGEYARKKAFSGFNWNDIIQRHIEIYFSILDLSKNKNRGF